MYLACGEKKSGAEGEEYNSRVKNIFNFLKENKQIGSIDSCHILFLLQANKCGLCTRDDLNTIFEEIRNVRLDSFVFILNGFNDSIMNFLLEKNSTVPFRTIVDQNGSLNKQGLSFMKNLQIRICNGEVISWKFYD